VADATGVRRIESARAIGAVRRSWRSWACRGQANQRSVKNWLRASAGPSKHRSDWRNGLSVLIAADTEKCGKVIRSANIMRAERRRFVYTA
jgi:hypothetical protein